MNSLAVVNGQQLIQAVIWVIAIGLVCWLLWFLIGYIGLPEPFNKVARVIVMVVAVLFLINVILTLAGHPLIAW
jgi:hypothetical protein